MEEPRAMLEADMFNTTAYGKVVVKYMQAVKYVQFICFFEIWILGRVETAPVPIHHFDFQC